MLTDVEVLTGHPHAASPSGEHARVPTIDVIGDPLECLAALRSAPEARTIASGRAVTGGYRAVVIGVDIRGLRTPREVRARLRLIEDQSASLCGRMRRLEHIVLILNGSDALCEDAVLRMSDSAARRIHTRLEQAYARSVVITAVLAERCDDAELLASRVIARAREREALDAGIALRWTDIVRTSIGVAGMNAYL